MLQIIELQSFKNQQSTKLTAILNHKFKSLFQFHFIFIFFIYLFRESVAKIQIIELLIIKNNQNLNLRAIICRKIR